MKKIVSGLLLTACAAGLTFAQTSRVKTATAGLIEDGVIDNLDFGFDEDEEGKGIVFFGTNATSVDAGWGQYMADSLWLSVYDRYNFYGSRTNTDSVSKTYGSADGVDVDYTDPTKTSTVDTSSKYFYNKLAVGIALNKSMGFQPYWTANWTKYNAIPTITSGAAVTGTTTTESTESSTTTTGTKTGSEYTDVKNRAHTNIFGVNFSGIESPKLWGDHELYFGLNEVRLGLYRRELSSSLSTFTRVNGTTTQSVGAEGENREGSYIEPGINLELGFGLGELGPAKVSFTLEEDFAIRFDLSESTSSYTRVVDNTTTKTTTSTSYEKNYGDYKHWENTLTPKFDFDFDLDERLTLKTRASFALGFEKDFNGGDTQNVVTRTTFYDKSSNNTTVTTTNVKSSDGTQDVDIFTTTITPEFDFGVVFKAVPDRLNVNFGAVVTTGTFTWRKTDKTNTNENTVTTTTNKDALGNETTTTTVNVSADGAESSQVYFNNGATSARLYLGLTWFFNPNVKMDVYYSNLATSFFNTTNTFGIDFAIKY